MKKTFFLSLLFLIVSAPLAFSQKKEEIVQSIVEEVYENSHLEILAHELIDVIGPRLVGTPQMQQAHDWAIEKYEGWGITAENQHWGEWKGWERGVTHIDMLTPRIQTLAGTQLAWNPATPDGGITAECIIIPEVKDAQSFQKWLPNVEGKFVLIAMKEPTGRPDYNWEEYATPESFAKMKSEREEKKKAWEDNLRRAGYNKRSIIPVLEAAGAAGIVDNYWSRGFGTDKIFGARTKSIPTVDIELEDYTMLYRMIEHGAKPEIRVIAESKDLGVVPTFNTIARIEGTEKPDEYVILSAHFDSWDGATGATDNGTGTLVMMETMRILKKIYPNPRRTILAGHWGSEEQGLNGSAAFVADHPDIVKNVQAVFNQDNGTGRVVNINGSGFLHSYEYLTRWLQAVPDTVTRHIETEFPGVPARGGTDHASFVAAGAPGFNLFSLNWSYWDYTWHTNRDTYDKIVFDDVKNNVVLTTILAYMASEDLEKTSREKSVLPMDARTGNPQIWPSPRIPQRRGMLD